MSPPGEKSGGGISARRRNRNSTLPLGRKAGPAPKPVAWPLRLNGLVANIEDFRKLVAGDHGLVVVSAIRNDGTISSSVVNAGVLRHPVTGETVVGMVVRGGTRKLANWRQRPYANVVIRSGWQWAAAEGRVDLIGPDDQEPSIDADRLRLLLREIFTAAGGTHDDFDTYDRVMREERRTAVFVHPDRVYANPGQ
jgi:PPOX class probable F420-dependent enzyme